MPSIFDPESLKKYTEVLDTVSEDQNVVHLAIVGDSDEVAVHVATRITTENGVHWVVGGAVGYMPKKNSWEAGATLLVTWPHKG